MNHGNAFSLHMFFPFGDPDGLRVVKKDNWSGRAIAFSQDRMDEAARWSDLEHPGVYILRGEEGQEVRIYIGETDNLVNRLKRHLDDGDRDFWTRAVAFVRAGDNLDKAEIKYLEARLIQLAEAAGWCILDNVQRPDPTGKLEEDRRAAAEGYLEELLEFLQALGIPEFQPPEPPQPAMGSKDDDPAVPSPTDAPCDQGDRLLQVKQKGVKARGHYLPDCRQFEVFDGATAARDEVPSLSGRPYRAARKLRKRLIDERILVEDEELGVYVLQGNQIFNSPSQAEQVLAGRPGSGQPTWPLVDTGDAAGSDGDEPAEPEDDAD